MVNEHKQDEEKDKRGFQKLRVRSPQTMTIDSPAPSKQQVFVDAQKPRGKLRGDHEPDTITIEVPSNDKKEHVKNTPQPASKKHVLLLPLELAPKKLRDHDPDTIAVEMPASAKERLIEDKQYKTKMDEFNQKRGKSKKEVKAPSSAPAATANKKFRPGKKIEPTVTVELVVPSADTTES
ncbi:hypothetical protein M3Y94_01015600 [Aphelenchoides besseyi]|nr:hypothetical protein M3Y94_01015600 [Aphelenchoides besseyi]